MKGNINTKRIIENMEQKNIKVVSIDTDNMLYMCDDGNEYPLMDGLENLTVEELQEHINKARLTTINILKEMEIDNGDINYNRKVKFLGLSSLKQEVEHIARKYDIAVSTVHSSYTSKMCPICGCIEDENRPNQETFECIECGYKSNADFNAANNIKNRVSITVLCNSLLKQMDNGAYEPKNLKREKVKGVLLSFRRNLQKVGSECGECSMTTFDYV